MILLIMSSVIMATAYMMLFECTGLFKKYDLNLKGQIGMFFVLNVIWPVLLVTGIFNVVYCIIILLTRK